MDLRIEKVVQQANENISDYAICSFCSNTPYEYTEKLVLACIRNNFYAEWLKVLHGERIVAVAFLQNIEHGWNTTVLQHVLVSPEYQKKGVGSYLIQHIKNNSARVILSTKSDLLEFYKNQGFVFHFTASQIGKALMKKFTRGRGLQSSTLEQLNNIPVFNVLCTKKISIQKVIPIVLKFSM